MKNTFSFVLEMKFAMLRWKTLEIVNSGHTSDLTVSNERKQVRFSGRFGRYRRLVYVYKTFPAAMVLKERYIYCLLIDTYDLYMSCSELNISVNNTI